MHTHICIICSVCKDCREFSFVKRIFCYFVITNSCLFENFAPAEKKECLNSTAFISFYLIIFQINFLDLWLLFVQNFNSIPKKAIILMQYYFQRLCVPNFAFGYNSIDTHFKWCSFTVNLSTMTETIYNSIFWL